MHHVTAQLIRLLTEAQPIELRGDEGKKGPRYKIGQRRILQDKADLLFSVAVYQEEDRDQMAEIIKPAVGSRAGLPMGHLQYESGDKDASGVSAMIYVGDEGVAAQAIFWHDTDHPWSERAENHFAEASSLGLGEQWTNSLLHYLRGEPAVESITLTYEEWQTMQLNTTLREYTDNLDDA